MMNKNELRIAFMTEMGFVGKIDRFTNPNMRTEFCWMSALNATHYPISNFQLVWDHDIVIIIWPKGNAVTNSEGIEVILNKQDNFSKYAGIPIIETLKQNRNKVVAYMQEGPTWFSNDYTIINQIYHFNIIQESDIIFAHNEYDTRYYKGMFPGKRVEVMRSLMYVDHLDNKIQYDRQERAIIGGNMCRWYGGFQSYIIASIFNVPIDIPTMHNRRDGEEFLENLHHLPYMSWNDWIINLSKYKYAVHLMPTIAAGTFNMNCAYWGIPCIGNKYVGTQRICFPSLSVDINDIQSARELAIRLKEDTTFYQHCSEFAKEAYNNFYGEQNFLEHFYKSIEGIL